MNRRIGGKLNRTRYPKRIEGFPKQTFKGWVNFYQNPDGSVFAGKVHLRPKDANHAFVKACGKPIACIYLEFTEGQGL